MSIKQIIIPVGEYGVSNDSHNELVTVLGSCVAVTLYNKKAQTGGLIHIVLPGKRTQRREKDKNSFYADTGIELLIDEMERFNSRKSDLVANVVGGASILFQSNENTIGQKNVAAVIKFLRSNNVPIEIVDTGGNRGRKISFSIKTGKIRTQKTSSLGTQNKFVSKIKQRSFDLHPLIKQIEGVKPDDDAAEKLLQVVHDHESSTRDLQNIISKDFVLSYHILRMCNSPYYGLPLRVTSLHDARRLLGNKQFRLICVVAGTMRHQKRVSPEIHHLSKQLTYISYGTAIIAEQMSDLIFPEGKNEVYTAGLLHGIGRFGKALQNEDSFNEVAPFNESHSVLAKKILEKWNIPNSIVTAIVNYEAPHQDGQPVEMITAILHVASGISRLLGLCSETSLCIDRISYKCMAELNLHEGLESLMPSIVSSLKSVGIFNKVKINKGMFPYHEQ